ncbi:hypothetical protein ABZ863_13580 [Saccharomonospora sp. NPDC046836]|uniref:hypothetical protein n=1 Tax=Saccharomonospora sp. NPDC046836 TaxID=3156921 RepID=UPI0033D33E19
MVLHQQAVADGHERAEVQARGLARGGLARHVSRGLAAARVLDEDPVADGSDAASIAENPVAEQFSVRLEQLTGRFL